MVINDLKINDEFHKSLYLVDDILYFNIDGTYLEFF